jgi:hypothetical protein
LLCIFTYLASILLSEWRWNALNVSWAIASERESERVGLVGVRVGVGVGSRE